MNELIELNDSSEEMVKMVFFSPVFTTIIIDESKLCVECKKEFGELDYYSGEILSGEVVQCTRYDKFCIGCCP